MYFNNIVEKVAVIPSYFIEDLLKNKDLLRMTLDERHIISKNNKIQRFMDAVGPLKTNIGDITSYVLSQQLPFLKNMVTAESGVACLDEMAGGIIMPTRYIARAGEQILVPIRGTAKITSSEFKGPEELLPGNIYRLNNRVNSTFTNSADFLTVFFSLIDFDLKKYLMAHDLQSPYSRKDDEYYNGNNGGVVKVIPTY